MTPDVRTEREAEAPVAPIGEANPSLRARYEAYRVQQGRDLLALLPREGMREVLRSLHVGEDEGFDFALDDGFEALAAKCAGLLPLPPFEVWARDFGAHRAAYGGAEAAPLANSSGPVVVAVAEFTSESGDEWVASLELRALGEVWSGAVLFHRPSTPGTCRTGPILREPHPEDVRSRFEGFDRTTLRALLRSALP